MKLNWEIIHECDDDDGNPTQWALEINHPLHGKFCWISETWTKQGHYFAVEVLTDGEIGRICFKELVQCKSLTSAKRWVSRYLIKR